MNVGTQHIIDEIEREDIDPYELLQCQRDMQTLEQEYGEAFTLCRAFERDAIEKAARFHLNP